MKRRVWIKKRRVRSRMSHLAIFVVLAILRMVVNAGVVTDLLLLATGTTLGLVQATEAGGEERKSEHVHCLCLGVKTRKLTDGG